MIVPILYLMIAALWYWKVELVMEYGKPASRKDRLMIAAIWPLFAFIMGLLLFAGLVVVADLRKHRRTK